MRAWLPRSPTISCLLTKSPGASEVFGSEARSLEASRVNRVSLWISPKAEEPCVLLVENRKRQMSLIKQTVCLLFSDILICQVPRGLKDIYHVEDNRLAI